MTAPNLFRDEKGAGALEFALAAPAILMFIVGIAQLGMLCMADAGLNTAVAEGARAAAVYPTPNDSTVIDRINSARWGMQTSRITGPTISRGTDSNGNAYLDITMSYSAPLDFIFLRLQPVNLSKVRRVYIQGTGSSSSSSSTSASSTSASTSASSTSSGATSSGWGGTSSSTGGATTTSTSSGTTSASTSSTSTTSASTSSTSTSSGNGNGNGHGHGNGNGNGHGNGNGNGH